MTRTLLTMKMIKDLPDLEIIKILIQDRKSDCTNVYAPQYLKLVSLERKIDKNEIIEIKEFDLKRMSKNIDELKAWIKDSEMEGKVDRSDSFYPIYKNLTELKDKIDEDADLEAVQN